MNSLAALWRDRVTTTPDRLAFRHRAGGAWQPMTWRHAGAEVERIAGGLLARGLQRGERVAVLCGTRVEWILVDFGILCAGGATTTVYPSSTPEQCRHILTDSEARVCVVETRAHLEMVRALQSTLPALHTVVCIEPSEDLPQETGPLLELDLHGLARLGEGRSAEVCATIDALGPEDLATLQYTSGTTGPPKGVVLVHDNWLYQAEVLDAVSRPTLQPDDTQYLFLPLSHAFGKILELFAVAVGLPTFVDGDLGRVMDGIRETRPTIVGSVPRMFEKAHEALLADEPRTGWAWALEVGAEVAAVVQRGDAVPLGLRLRLAVADRVALRSIRQWFGGRIRCFLSGGAPLDPEISRFFQSAGVWVLEGYGLTETAAGSVGNRIHEFRPGTVGRPQPGAEVRIADDGEILLRHRGIMRGYHGLPEATAAVLDADGWLYTGDLGTVDDDGFVRITGRKKDLIITAGGKNIAPQEIEGRVKARCRRIGEIVMHGDRRPYCVALVWPEPDALSAWAATEPLLAPLSMDALLRHPDTRARLLADLGEVNRSLASYETIKDIVVVHEPLSVDGGGLTPSMKVRRHHLESRYASALDACYLTRSHR